MDKKIDRILEKLKQKFPGVEVGTADEIIGKPDTISTPFPTLNDLIGGGFPRGHFTTIAGPERTGKGTLLLQTIAYQQARDPEFITVYTDAENSLDPKWMHQLGVDTSRVLVQRYSGEASMENLLDLGISLCMELSADLWIIDSIGALLPKAELQRLEDGKMLNLQRKMGEFYRKSNVLLPKKTAIILIGQVYTVPTANVALEEVRGGNAVKHWAHLRLKTRRMGKTEAPEAPQNVVLPDGRTKKVSTGWTCRIKLEKTRMNEKEGQEIALPFFYGRGFDSARAVLAAALGRGLIKRSGAFYEYKDKRFHGRAELVEYFQQNSQAIDVLGKELEAQDDEPEIESTTEEP